jgi:acyl-CoA synthetase (AMP-forming)/AMP-acid ligase II
VRADLEHGNIGRLVASAAGQHATSPAVREDDTTLTYAELGAAVTEAARGFVAAGVEIGDRVAIWAPNSSDWIVAALGALTAGGVLVPMNTRYKGDEAAYVLQRSGARVLVCAQGFLDADHIGMLTASGVSFGAGWVSVVTIGDEHDEATAWASFLAAGAHVTDAEIERRLAMVGADDLSDVMFTSGTTGRPKGAMLTHGQTLRVFDDWCDLVGLVRGDQYLIVNPFFHTFGYKAGIIGSLLRGATMYPVAQFDAAEVAARVAADRITVLPGAPTLFQSILNLPGREALDLSSLRLAITGAAVVPVEMILRMRSELGFTGVLTGYGLTETNGTATMCSHDDSPETVAVSCGRAVPDTEVQVVRPTGEPCPNGDPGEVLIRGYHVMRGYLDDPAATADAIDAEGWLHTGDIGVLDDHGYLRITDRLKDMFIVGGFNAYPAEIEQTMTRHPAIAQVAVVARADERMGEVGVAFVVPRSGVSLDIDELRAWCRDTMANFKVPREFVEVAELPTNASGKIDKLALRRRLASS